MAFFHITSPLKKMEMQMEYFFWTAMPWVCLDITMPFSTMHYYMSLVLPSQSILLFAALSSLYIIHFSPPLLDWVNELTITRWWWAKYRDLSLVSRDQLFASAERQIIDPLTTDKLWSFAITEFNNCFIIRSPSLFFNEHLREAAIFTQERSQEGEKRGFIYVWAEGYLQPNTKPNTVGRHCAWAVHYS